MLLRLPNGLTVESVLTRKKFPKWQDAHLEFPRIVFQGKQAVQTLREKPLIRANVQTVCRKCAAAFLHKERTPNLTI